MYEQMPLFSVLHRTLDKKSVFLSVCVYLNWLLRYVLFV